MDTVECPYCKHEQEVNHDEYYEQDTTHQIQCNNCKKHFVFETSISFYYKPKKADCLNDNKHDYQPTKTFPKAFTEMRCTMCDDTRGLTNKERESLGIETTTEYWKKRKF